MIYGYARVSTKGQAKDGNSLEAQEVALREAGAAEVYTAEEVLGDPRLKRGIEKAVTEICRRD